MAGRVPVVGEGPMKRTLMLTALFVALSSSLVWLGHSLADPRRSSYSGPDWGKDPPPPPPKIVKLIGLLFT